MASYEKWPFGVSLAAVSLLLYVGGLAWSNQGLRMMG